MGEGGSVLGFLLRVGATGQGYALGEKSRLGTECPNSLPLVQFNVWLLWWFFVVRIIGICDNKL